MTISKHSFDAYHLKYNSSWGLRDYIIAMFKNHFIHLENVRSVICSHWAFKKGETPILDSDVAKLRFSFYNKYQKNWKDDDFITLDKMNNGEPITKKLSDCQAIYENKYINYKALMGSFYQDVLDNSSFLIVTSKHNASYEALESEIDGCHIIDMDSAKLYIKDTERKVSYTDEEEEHIEILKKFEQDYLLFAKKEIKKDDDDWTSLLFPYFFLDKFLGFVIIVFEGLLDVNSIRQSAEFMQKAHSLFNRSIVDSIVDEWIKCKRKEPLQFVDFLKYIFQFGNCTERCEGLKNIYQSFLRKDLNNGVSVFIPPFHHNSHIHIPILIKVNQEDPAVSTSDDSTDETSMEYCYYLKHPIKYSDEEMRVYSFEVITQIQWLWHRWTCGNAGLVEKTTIV